MIQKQSDYAQLALCFMLIDLSPQHTQDKLQHRGISQTRGAPASRFYWDDFALGQD